VGVNPVVQEVEAIAAPTVTTITLRSAWTGTGGTYSFLANQTSEGLRDAVQAIRSNNASLQSFIDSIDTAATADSVAQRTSDGSINAVNVYASGNVGVGTSSPSALGKTLNIEGGSGGASLAIDGGDNFAVMYTGPTADDPTSLFSNTGFKFATATAKDATGFAERMKIDSAGNVGIGTSSPATKLDVSGAIRASTGILFGSDTAAANTLDDYEEGTWTPVLRIDNSTSGVTTSVAAGYYKKIGSVVFLWGVITLSSRGGRTGEISITNTPFNSTYDGTQHTSQTGNVRIGSASSLSSSSLTCLKGTPYGVQGISIFLQNSTETSTLLASELTDTAGISFSVTYSVD
jgi:hypothetical protein